MFTLNCCLQCIYMYNGGSSFFSGKVTALGVLCCFTLFVCLTLLASFFLPSHLSFKNMYIIVVAECKRRLAAAGFSELNMKESWKVQPSGKVRHFLGKIL